MELFSIRIQRTFQLVSTSMYNAETNKNLPFIKRITYVLQYLTSYCKKVCFIFWPADCFSLQDVVSLSVYCLFTCSSIYDQNARFI